jgi:2-polyprenyl-6-methoxyphenol hydroxylase-like FAD-dependent oxidoreductase
MPSKFNIVIIGGGIAGFAASVGLARKGHSVTVLERSPALQTWGGALLISSNALRVIEEYGLLRIFREATEKWENHTIYRHDGKVLDVLSNAANEKVFGYEYAFQVLLYCPFSKFKNFPKMEVGLVDFWP